MDDNPRGSIINLMGWNPAFGFLGGQFKAVADRYQFTSPCISQFWKTTELHACEGMCSSYLTASSHVTQNILLWR